MWVCRNLFFAEAGGSVEFSSPESREANLLEDFMEKLDKYLKDHEIDNWDVAQ